ncbi:MAG TPA: MFS transporter [Burkholderiaceae bacterium]|nr:MFS transporter [Burkholderiaceae bacterium]
MQSPGGTPTNVAPGVRPFFGRRVVRAAFTLAMFGWGIGFYGPPVYLHAVIERTGWSLSWVSSAVTVHYLFGALVVTQLPRLHARWGVGATAAAGAMIVTLGVFGWAVCVEPWQLMVAALLSGGGWVTMGAVAVNAVIAPWFVRTRPAALATAYNGASIGGVVFSPLWVALIAAWGFTHAALTVGMVTIAVMVWLTRSVFRFGPGHLGQHADGVVAAPASPSSGSVPSRPPLQGVLLWRDRRFRTLALGMAIGLFAQIGLLAHLLVLLEPVLGAQAAGWAMGLATACAIAGRSVVAWAMPAGANRRNVAAAAYGVQWIGTLLLCVLDSSQVALIVLAIVLFGSGIGNATSLPPLIAQQEFAHDDVARVVALIVAIAQGTYAFAPAVFGALLQASAGGAARIGHGTSAFLLTVAGVQLLAIGCFVLGRRSA